MFTIPLLLLCLTAATTAQEQITDARPTLTFFTVNDCSDCDIAKQAWDQMVKLEPPDLNLVEVSYVVNTYLFYYIMYFACVNLVGDIVSLMKV